MKAIAVEKYGSIEELQARTVEHPGKPKGRDLLVQVRATSVNPIDIKVRKGVYDDAPDYYKKVAGLKPYQCIGYDGAGVVVEVGPDVKFFKPGDEIFYVSPPIRQGTNQEYQHVNETTVAHKPKSLDFVEAAALPLTYGTAYETLVERMGIKKGENVGLLIINGAGGVGSVASQIARTVLELPVVVTTASRPETVAFTKKMGATHVINHREDLRPQIKALNLDVPIKYIFITYDTKQYLEVAADICAPLGTISSIVQSPVSFLGTQFLSKSLTFCWVWLGTKSYHSVKRQEQFNMMEELVRFVDEGKIKPHLTKRLKLTAEGLREAHRLIESSTTIGKIGLGVDEEGPGEPFA